MATLMIPAMSRAQDAGSKKIPDFSERSRKDVPVDYTWKIEDIYPTQEAWKADKEALNALVAQIDEKSKDWTGSAQKMLALLDLQKEINMKSSKLYSYAGHQYDTDMGNTELQAMKGELQAIFVQLGAKFAFLNPDLLALGADKFNACAKAEPKLEVYRFFVEDVIRSKAHILPEDQEKIVSLSGLFSGSTNKAAKMLNDLEVPHSEVTLSDGKRIPLNMANYSVYRSSANAADRDLVMRTFWDDQKKFENTFAILQDGAIKQHKFSAQVHKFDDCLSARLWDDNIPVDVYNMLIKEVRENLGPLHRYLTLKKKLLKLDKFRYADVYASAVPTVEKSYTYDEAKQLVINATQPLGKEYTEVLTNAFNSRWVDIYPNKGKETGAYSGGVYGIHPYVKMNFNGKYDAVSTLAHELGHSMHSYFSNKTQDFVNSGYPTFIAEIASTFNENLLTQYLLKNEKDDLFKLYLLDSYLEQIRATLFRQTLFAEFELAMHQRVEEGKTLTPDFLDQKYLDLTRTYYGHDKGVCEVDDYIRCEWTRIPHFYMNYYVFQYSTGIIASLALSNMVLNGEQDAQARYLDLLKAGGSDYAIPLLKKAGVDMTQPGPYLAALKRFDDMVGEMEKIVTKLQAEKKL